MADKKSILINKKSHRILTELAKEHKMNYQTFVEEMLYFFKRTGQDPRLNKSMSPTNMIKTLDKRMVSFFQTQERDILNPIRNEIYENSKQNKQLIIQLSSSIKNAFEISNRKHSEEINELLEKIKKII